MKLFFSAPFQKDYQNLPADAQKALDKALQFLMVNPRHPSLRAKKLPGTEIWYARVTSSLRFTFQIDGEMSILRRAGSHDVLTKERKRKS